MSSFFAIVLFQAAPRLEAPVYFLEGRQDHVVTGEVAEKYFNALEASRGKQLIWFEQSAHWPQLEEPEKFNPESGSIRRPRFLAPAASLRTHREFAPVCHDFVAPI